MLWNYISYIIQLLRSHTNALKGVVFSFSIPLFALGWISIASARINPFLLIVFFPLLSGICIVASSLIMIRAEGQNLMKLQTIPGGLKSVVLGVIQFSLLILLIEHVLFSTATVSFRDMFVMFWSDSFTPSNYVPDADVLLILLVVASLIYASYSAFVPWMLGNLRIARLVDDEGFVEFEGFVIEPWFLIGVLLLMATYFPFYPVFQTIVSSDPTYITIVVGGIITAIYSLVLSIVFWRLGFKRMNKKYSNID